MCATMGQASTCAMPTSFFARATAAGCGRRQQRTRERRSTSHWMMQAAGADRIEPMACGHGTTFRSHFIPRYAKQAYSSFSRGSSSIDVAQRVNPSAGLWQNRSTGSGRAPWAKRAGVRLRGHQRPAKRDEDSQLNLQLSQLRGRRVPGLPSFEAISIMTNGV